MGKEIFTGRVLLTRFFKEFFLKALERVKTAALFFLSENSVTRRRESPPHFSVHGHMGSKTSALNACIRVAEDAAEEAKRN